MGGKWYRGEGVGVGPGRPGGALHDLGDGLYLSDSEDVALLYGRTRAASAKGYRVLEVSINRSDLGNVLDLTADSRWLKFMTRPMVPGTKNVESRLDYLQIKHELYQQFFEEFIRENNIKIYSYDAVIGPEYVRGGKQLCILYRNGMQTTLSKRIGSLLRPRLAEGEFEFRPAVDWTPRINAAARGVSLRSGFKTAMSQAGEVALTLGIGIGLALLEYWMMKGMIEDKLKEGLKNVGPQIATRIQNTAAEIAKLQLKLDKGEKVFANAVVQIIWEEYSAPRGGGTYTEPEVVLADLYLTTRPVERDRTFNAMIHQVPKGARADPLGYPMASRKIDELTRPFEVSIYSDDELEEFQELKTAYLEATRMAKMDPYSEHLAEAVRTIREQITYTFGPDVWVFQL